mmetsp:Transcript_17152/g.36795  ORF Transcript_17152/g.36795 Transcript_17152/m.36795 type:complete len:406 (+) Transcript_17152:696-1913(+)
MAAKSEKEAACRNAGRGEPAAASASASTAFKRGDRQSRRCQPGILRACFATPPPQLLDGLLMRRVGRVHDEVARGHAEERGDEEQCEARRHRQVGAKAALLCVRYDVGVVAPHRAVDAVALVPHEEVGETVQFETRGNHHEHEHVDGRPGVQHLRHGDEAMALLARHWQQPHQEEEREPQQRHEEAERVEDALQEIHRGGGRVRAGVANGARHAEEGVGRVRLVGRQDGAGEAADAQRKGVGGSGGEEGGEAEQQEHHYADLHACRERHLAEEAEAREVDAAQRRARRNLWRPLNTAHTAKVVHSVDVVPAADGTSASAILAVCRDGRRGEGRHQVAGESGVRQRAVVRVRLARRVGVVSAEHARLERVVAVGVGGHGGGAPLHRQEDVRQDEGEPRGGEEGEDA